MSLFDKIIKSKSEELDTKPQFRYHPNVWTLNIFNETTENNKVTCQCCNNATKYYLTNMYTQETVDCICPECVASGKASEKFNGEFIKLQKSIKFLMKQKEKNYFAKHLDMKAGKENIG